MLALKKKFFDWEIWVTLDIGLNFLIKFSRISSAPWISDFKTAVFSYIACNYKFLFASLRKSELH